MESRTVSALATIKGYVLVTENEGEWEYAIIRLADGHRVFRSLTADGQHEYDGQTLLDRLDHFVNGRGSKPALVRSVH